jgi:hypothetical protein
MKVKPLFTIADIGPYADSARGIYTGALIIEMAATHGFKPYGEDIFDSFDAWSPIDRWAWCTAWEQYLTERDDYLELWEEAENYLNAMCDDSVYFGSSEQGDWGLWSVDEEEDEEDLLVLSGSMVSVPWGVVSEEGNEDE